MNPAYGGNIGVLTAPVAAKPYRAFREVGKPFLAKCLEIAIIQLMVEEEG